MQKKAWVYKLVLILWVLFSLFLLDYLLRQCRAAENVFVMILLSLSVFSLIIFWLGSVRDLTFSVVFAILGKRMMRAYEPIWAKKTVQTPRFVLLYCTYNDFNAKALSFCMRQDYENFETVILDDSTKAEYKEEIDRFAVENGISVVRRKDRVHYKAGNLNHYLKDRVDYDYFVVLDSDERIPPDFIRRSLRYFAHDEKIGAVQARHVASRGHNAFQRLLGLSVESNGRTAQVVKNFYGSNALLGHGMAISLDCYRASGGFPPVVAEDISFAVQIKDAGYEIVYAPDIVCEEEFPSDYVSLKKRQCKWTQGNLEYMQKYNASIIGSKLRWFEKLDMILSHYMLPITPILSLVLVLSNILLGFFDYAVIEH
ncbi:MAG: glycosyltransferase, partial [Clostridia bacterium]|nr:glycosyltransferase [Clostridia bacterium]